MKKLLRVSTWLGLMLAAASLAAVGEPVESINPDLVNLKAPAEISGTYRDWYHGQIVMTTDSGETVVLPQSALTYACPQVSQGELLAGQRLTLWLPERSVLRVIDGRNPTLILGNYEGVARVPTTTMAKWDIDNSVWTAER